MEKDPEFTERRVEMVDRYIREGCLRKGSKLADAMGNVPCEVFMPDRYVEGLYSDNAFQILLLRAGADHIGTLYVSAILQASKARGRE